MSFENQIQQWIILDNEVKKIYEKLKELREKRNTCESNIISYASSNNLSNSTVKLNDCKLKFANTKVVEPLTFKYLEKSLHEVIKNESQVKLIIEYIKENRNTKLTQEIKRYYNN